jgi:hypothetical protein
MTAMPLIELMAVLVWSGVLARSGWLLLHPRHEGAHA